MSQLLATRVRSRPRFGSWWSHAKQIVSRCFGESVSYSTFTSDSGDDVAAGCGCGRRPLRFACAQTRPAGSTLPMAVAPMRQAARGGQEVAARDAAFVVLILAAVASELVRWLRIVRSDCCAWFHDRSFLPDRLDLTCRRPSLRH